MSIEIKDIFPNVNQGLSNIGFIFGAGTSKKAGYPLLPELTTMVLSNLDQDRLESLNNLVKNEYGKDIDLESGDPNIETISDLIEVALMTIDRSSPNHELLTSSKESVRDSIVDVITANENPYLDDHIKFFQAIRRIYSGRSEVIWLLTPNYDLSFSVAAAIARVPIIDGFFGSSIRYFDIQTYNLNLGIIRGDRFSPYAHPIIGLIKLHGSLDWWKYSDAIYATRQPADLPDEAKRVMVLPRKKKISETLESPYGDLFRFARNIIGTKCKYLVSCGYSFGDEHINETLLLPNLRESKIRLTAFLRSDNPNLDKFRPLPPFSFGSETEVKISGVEGDSGTDLWKFEDFVDLFGRLAGL